MTPRMQMIYNYILAVLGVCGDPDFRRYHAKKIMDTDVSNHGTRFSQVVFTNLERPEIQGGRFLYHHQESDQQGLLSYLERHTFGATGPLSLLCGGSWMYVRSKSHH